MMFVKIKSMIRRSDDKVVIIDCKDIESRETLKNRERKAHNRKRVIRISVAFVYGVIRGIVLYVIMVAIVAIVMAVLSIFENDK